MRIARLSLGLILALVSVYLPAQPPCYAMVSARHMFPEWP